MTGRGQPPAAAGDGDGVGGGDADVEAGGLHAIAADVVAVAEIVELAAAHLPLLDLREIKAHVAELEKAVLDHAVGAYHRVAHEIAAEWNGAAVQFQEQFGVKPGIVTVSGRAMGMSKPPGSKGHSVFGILDLVSKCIQGFVFAIAVLAPLDRSQATTFKVLHTFTGDDGCDPAGGLILDGVGNLYGTTAGGVCPGDSDGTVFELEPDGTEIVLHAFTGGSNGDGPDNNLVMDQRGNLYGATIGGGSVGCGVMFKVASNGTEKTLHDFVGAPNDGCIALGTMILDEKGNLYGTTSGGGKNGGGTIFELAPDGAETVLYSFCPGRTPPHCPDGAYPLAGLLVGAGSNYFGSAGYGGSRKNSGAVFELSPGGPQTVLYKFRGSPNDGALPQASLIMGKSGGFYGTLTFGGNGGCLGDAGCGAAFKLARDGTETVLHFFTGKHGDGANPVAGLIADNAGNLYGTTQDGGGLGCSGLGCGTVFELAPDGTETVLHSFGKGNNGARLLGGLVADSVGDFYGTANEGGAYGYGTVFEIKP